MFPFTTIVLQMLIFLSMGLSDTITNAEQIQQMSRGAYAVSCPEGFGDLLDPQYFEVFGHWQNRYGRDNLKLSAHFLMIFQTQIEPVLDEALLKCPGFVLETMMNAMLKIETDEGAAAARSWLLTIYGLRDRAFASGSAEVKEQLQVLMDEWAVDIAAVYPKLLDIERLGPFKNLQARPSTSSFGAAAVAASETEQDVDMESRFCQGQRFYLYELQESFYKPGAFYCLQGQWGTEVLLHHYFRHTCNTKDPELADWFYVPLYATCVYVKLNENVTDESTMLEDMDSVSDTYIFQPMIEFLKHSKFFHRNRGKDHVFIFPDGQGPRIWDSYDLLRGESVFLSPESKCPTWGEKVRRYVDVKPCLTSWKDIIIPGHTDYARIMYMRKHNKPIEERRLLATFHGRLPGAHAAYGDCMVRGKLQEMTRHGLHVDVGGFVDDYPERKGDAHFCLVPAGTSPWTNHLYESFYAGCIPVILSDEYEVAFLEDLDWPSFSIKWPEVEVGDKLYEHLKDLIEYFPGKVAAMKAQLERHACWFNWYSTDIDCNPFLLIQKKLKRLLQARVRRPRFWNIGLDGLNDQADEPPLVFAHLRRPTRFKHNPNEASNFSYFLADAQPDG